MHTEFRLDQPLNGRENMDIDESLFHQFNKPEYGGRDFCCVRIYEWAHPTLSAGFAQEKRDIFNDRVKQDKLDTVIRITGGRVVLHHQEITYSVVGPAHGAFGSLHSAYEIISTILKIFLKNLGILPDQEIGRPREYTTRGLICYDNLGYKEISLQGRKLIGSAQKRGKHAFLQHGSIPFFRHEYRVEDYLKPEFLPLQIINRNEGYTFLNDFTDISLSDAKEMLLQVFQQEISRVMDQNISAEKKFNFVKTL